MNDVFPSKDGRVPLFYDLKRSVGDAMSPDGGDCRLEIPELTTIPRLIVTEHGMHLQ